ncbi:MAG: DUF4198 domain-containing protein [Acidobacteriota bacterium]
MKNRFVPALIAGVLLSTSAFAHDTWLSPVKTSIEAGAEAAFDLTSGMAFPALDYAIKAERVTSAACRLGGRSWPLASSAATKSLHLTARLETAGVAVCSVELAPKAIELKSDEVKEYLDEIGAPPSVREAWAAMHPQRWRELYSKHAKAVMVVGTGADEWASASLGSALELVPESEPAKWTQGAELVVRLLRHSVPVSGFAVGVIRQGAPGVNLTTDGDGRVRLRLESVGSYLFRATDVRKASAPNTDWESDFATLTLTVAR